MSPTWRRALWALGAGVLGMLAALTWRHYRLELAVVTGLAVGLLAFATLRTVARLGEIFRRRP